ncbi:MAG: hypothetical protein IPP25_10000 [Saprospiraceae bacterium]|nr:hypothetical protein [Candidatus Opimibacter skivensis]
MDDKTKSIVAHLTLGLAGLLPSCKIKLIKDQILPFISVKIWDYSLILAPAHWLVFDLRMISTIIYIAVLVLCGC